MTVVLWFETCCERQRTCLRILNVGNSICDRIVRLVFEGQLLNLSVIAVELARELRLLRLQFLLTLLRGVHRLANDLVAKPGVSRDRSHLVNHSRFDFTGWQRRMLTRLPPTLDRAYTGVVAINDRLAFGHVDNCDNVSRRKRRPPLSLHALILLDLQRKEENSQVSHVAAIVFADQH